MRPYQVYSVNRLATARQADLDIRPSLKWHIIEDDDEFDISGINVRSFTSKS